MSVRKVFVFCSVLVNIFFLFYFSRFNFVHNTQSMCPVSCNQTNLKQKSDVTHKQYRVAILTPTSHASLAQVEKGFQDTLIEKYQLPCDFTVYNANGNRTLMRSQVEEIIQKKYDLIFTIGAHATQMAKEITLKKEHRTPLVFGAIADPIRLNIINSEKSSGNHIVGDATSTNYPDQILLALKLRPSIKKVLIVYDPTQSSGLERDKLEVEKIFAKHQIATQAIEVYKTSDIMQKVASFIQEVDMVMIFKDNTVIPGIDSLIKLCNRYKVTLFASDLDSVSKGAAIGFGVHEYDFGVSGAELAYRILKNKENPAQMPLTYTRNYKLKLNTKTMRDQGLYLDEDQLLFVRSIEVI